MKKIAKILEFSCICINFNLFSSKSFFIVLLTFFYSTAHAMLLENQWRQGGSGMGQFLDDEADSYRAARNIRVLWPIAQRIMNRTFLIDPRDKLASNFLEGAFDACYEVLKENSHELLGTGYFLMASAKKVLKVIQELQKNHDISNFPNLIKDLAPDLEVELSVIRDDAFMLDLDVDSELKNIENIFSEMLDKESKIFQEVHMEIYEKESVTDSLADSRMREESTGLMMEEVKPEAVQKKLDSVQRSCSALVFKIKDLWTKNMDGEKLEALKVLTALEAYKVYFQQNKGYLAALAAYNPLTDQETQEKDKSLNFLTQEPKEKEREDVIMYLKDICRQVEKILQMGDMSWKNDEDSNLERIMVNLKNAVGILEINLKSDDRRYTVNYQNFNGLPKIVHKENTEDLATEKIFYNEEEKKTLKNIKDTNLFLWKIFDIIYFFGKDLDEEAFNRKIVDTKIFFRANIALINQIKTAKEKKYAMVVEIEKFFDKFETRGVGLTHQDVLAVKEKLEEYFSFCAPVREEIFSDFEVFLRDAKFYTKNMGLLQQTQSDHTKKIVLTPGQDVALKAQVDVLRRDITAYKENSCLLEVCDILAQANALKERLKMYGKISPAQHATYCQIFDQSMHADFVNPILEDVKNFLDNPLRPIYLWQGAHGASWKRHYENITQMAKDVLFRLAEYREKLYDNSIEIHWEDNPPEQTSGKSLHQNYRSVYFGAVKEEGEEDSIKESAAFKYASEEGFEGAVVSSRAWESRESQKIDSERISLETYVVPKQEDQRLHENYFSMPKYDSHKDLEFAFSQDVSMDSGRTRDARLSHHIDSRENSPGRSSPREKTPSKLKSIFGKIFGSKKQQKQHSMLNPSSEKNKTHEFLGTHKRNKTSQKNFLTNIPSIKEAGEEGDEYGYEYECEASYVPSEVSWGQSSIPNRVRHYPPSYAETEFIENSDYPVPVSSRPSIYHSQEEEKESEDYYVVKHSSVVKPSSRPDFR